MYQAKNFSILLFSNELLLKLSICFNLFIIHPFLSYGQEAKTVPLFQHGVASGDPAADRVILWTRISSQLAGKISVKWEISRDSLIRTILQSGQVVTDSLKDYTIKIDAAKLSPGQTYYYRFSTMGSYSPIGRTKTTPLQNVANLKFAVVSCSNYAEGYFSALDRIADRKNLDAVIHLGDYIYEGTERDFDQRGRKDIKSIDNPGRKKNKAWWLSYYRERYAISHLDSALNRAHQVHPFISVWDDHETADNAHRDGAKAHNPLTDGSWQERKEAARQAYFEWMPIRGNGPSIYRSISYGNLMELFMLDTRLEGRDKQIYDASSSALYDPDRTLLGSRQKQWLLTKLKSSTAQWKVIGNQVIFSPFYVSWAKIGPFASQVTGLENNLLDYWQGYPLERDSILEFISSNRIDNVVILSASMHCSLAFDVSLRPTDESRMGEKATYQSSDGKGSLAVEFATPSITSANFDEQIGSVMTKAFEERVNKPLPPPFNFNPNPHLKFVDLTEHGYLLLEVSKSKTQASWYFIEDKFKKNSKETLIESLHTLDKQNHFSK
ncbi:alkaline phosphatase D family protein [Rhodocytophaga aerolata]|uniref:Alkaline phosphatase D family protein n=1 Tax=Rhodocytophaga aerolata TaxID=455078 RepID=A0ABT8RCI0_9BACT|nr:alkaline phosphatase D family protein [Rhodocytophaga aerolata]MDO1449811.1 alkaline phosphatase D family protein [Rhodocytophaga aerolata]